MVSFQTFMCAEAYFFPKHDRSGCLLASIKETRQKHQKKRRQAANPLPQDENSLRKQTPHVRHSDPTTPADNEKEAGGGGGGVC